MAEALSPNVTTAKNRVPMASRLQSPTSPFFLGSNDDKLERAQARAARAAAIRRKSLAATTNNQHMECDPCLGKQQILELFQNCIKLASENKINQKNTWELNLIDHLGEIIKAEEEDAETNFQKASCTLEAGVRIYSLRVDSVHSEAYKVLGGINRVGLENEQGTVVDNADLNSEQEEGNSRKEADKKISPLSTLESSFEALNVKKIDVAFSVDPLYHQTSAQFDEGGAKGLLLNNLGVYGGCRVLFDSQEVPGNGMSCVDQCDKLDMIELSFARECIEQMVLNMRIKDEISPTLSHIVYQFDEDNQRSQDIFSSSNSVAEQVDAVVSHEAETDISMLENCGAWSYDHGNQNSEVDEDLNSADSIFHAHHEETEQSTSHGSGSGGKFEPVDGYLSLCLGITSKQNAWAGPDHWKYQKAKDAMRDPFRRDGSPVTTKRTRTRRPIEVDIDFLEALDKDMSDVFAPPKNTKSILLPTCRTPCSIMLPEDCHYQPEDLVKLFLVPKIMCLGRRKRKPLDEFSQGNDGCGQFSSWDNDGFLDAQVDDANSYSDVEDPNVLVPQPRQVNKVEVQYDKTSKQVDVQALKDTLWDHIRGSTLISSQPREVAISFKHILASFPCNCRAAATLKDISPHLCFICLLHLANEHGLSIQDCSTMDDLTIHFPHNIGFSSSLI